MITTLSWKDIYERVNFLPKGRCYGIPRGGQIIAGLTGNAVDSPTQAEFIIDDIIDSGKTKEQWEKETGLPVIALIDKQKENIKSWVIFPWENTQSDIEDCLIRQIQYIGEDPAREGLIDTPKRIIKSWQEIYGGYEENPKEILSKIFTQPHDEMVVLKNIELYSTCEHHMIPFIGKCHIAYIPDGKVVGLSKLARLMECFARRMQIQERLTNQIVDAIEEHLKPKGSACIIQAKHFCMCSRGVNKQNSEMMTSALRGAFLDDSRSREEFINLIKLN